jgi:hypothetical protein
MINAPLARRRKLEYFVMLIARVTEAMRYGHGAAVWRSTDGTILLIWNC